MKTIKNLIYTVTVLLTISATIFFLNNIEKLKTEDTANNNPEHLEYELIGDSSSFNPVISSSGNQKYLKASYTNNSNQKVKLCVRGKDINESINIDVGKTESLTWENTTNKSQKYEIEIRCSEINLLGKAVLETSDSLFN